MCSHHSTSNYFSAMPGGWEQLWVQLTVLFYSYWPLKPEERQQLQHDIEFRIQSEVSGYISFLALKLLRIVYGTEQRTVHGRARQESCEVLSQLSMEQKQLWNTGILPEHGSLSLTSQINHSTMNPIFCLSGQHQLVVGSSKDPE